MKKLIVAILLVACAAAGCSKSDPPRNYVNAANKFRINIPDDWAELKDWNSLGTNGLSELSLGGTANAAFVSSEYERLLPETSETGNPPNPVPPRAIISVKIVNAPSNGGGKALFEQEQADLVAKLAGVEWLRTSEDPSAPVLTTGNGKAYYVECSWKKDGEDRKGILVFVISARRAGMVLCGCAAGDFGHYETALRRACESFYLDLEQQ